MNNYMTLRSKVWWRQYFMYIDVQEYLADYAFIHEEVRIRFISEYTRQDSKYICVIASCKKRDWDKAERALNSLCNKMIIMGNTDYESTCDQIIGSWLNIGDKHDE